MAMIPGSPLAMPRIIRISRKTFPGAALARADCLGRPLEPTVQINQGRQIMDVDGSPRVDFYRRRWP